MITPSIESEIQAQETVIQILHELGFPCHRIGYKQLCKIIPLYAQDDRQSLTKDIYPAIAEYWGYENWQTIEHSVRIIIVFAWLHRDPATWDVYFHDNSKPPSNKLFIATIAECIKKSPSRFQEGQNCPENAAR